MNATTTAGRAVLRYSAKLACFTIAGWLLAAQPGSAADLPLLRVNIPAAKAPSVDPELASYLNQHFEAVSRMQQNTASAGPERRKPSQILVDSAQAQPTTSIASSNGTAHAFPAR